MKVKVILGIIAMLALLPFASADVNMTTTVYTTGNITSTNNLYGDAVDLIVNGVTWNMYNPNYIASNEYDWSKDRVGLTRSGVYHYFKESIDYIQNGGSTRKENVNLGMLLYSTFVPRWEVYNLFNNLDLRLKVIEDYLMRQDPEGFCQSAINVAKDQGWNNVTCGGKTYTLTDNQAIIVTPI